MNDGAGAGREASAPGRIRERYEWSNIWWDCADDPDLPRVLLIGDSISVGYGATVIERLNSRAHVDRLSHSRSIVDPVLTVQTRMMLADNTYASIHFNNGLHGWHLSTAAYADGLAACVSLLRAAAPGAFLWWASSTPVTRVDDPARLDPEKNAVVLDRNAAAMAAMATAGVPVHDLYQLVVDHPEWKTGDGYHFNEAGNRAMGEAVATRLEESLVVRA
jgi:lysophospholipase L1-like esterase